MFFAKPFVNPWWYFSDDLSKKPLFYYYFSLWLFQWPWKISIPPTISQGKNPKQQQKYKRDILKLNYNYDS